MVTTNHYYHYIFYCFIIPNINIFILLKHQCSYLQSVLDYQLFYKCLLFLMNIKSFKFMGNTLRKMFKLINLLLGLKMT